MLERDLIQSSGVRNTRKGSAITGFEFRLRMPSYRGMAASLIDGVRVEVDGKHHFDFDEPSWQLGGKVYDLTELQATQDVRWQLEEPATVHVQMPGGLARGTHRLDVELRLRMSYIPIEHQPSIYRASKMVTVIS